MHQQIHKTEGVKPHVLCAVYVSLGLFTLAGQTYEGGDYIDEASKRTNVLGAGVGQSKGQWNITLGVSAILGIQISISSKIKK